MTCVLLNTALVIDEIKRNEILPVVLSLRLNTADHTFMVPVDMYKIEIENRNIVNGSEFLFERDEKYSTQILFCPKKNSEDKCLEPIKSDQVNKQLKCIEEPTPVTRESQIRKNKCGVDGSGVLYEVVYNVRF